MADKKTSHGGKREGAGRPLLPETKRLKMVSIMLNDAQRAQARRIGLSIGDGIRRLLDAAAGRGAK